jgi:hypothetical protein
MTTKLKQKPWWVLPLIFGCTATLVACSSVTPPIDAISTADMAMNRALDANAAQLAPLDVRIAREKLDLAKANMGKEEYVFARRLAEEARVDARVAEARSKALTALESNREVKQTIDTLHQDVEQKTTDH